LKFEKYVKYVFSNSGIQKGALYLSKLLFKSNEEKVIKSLSKSQVYEFTDKN